MPNFLELIRPNLNFTEHPGLYFVAATLLPLASFVLILLSKFVWGVLRPYRDNPAVAPAYNLFGGDVGGPISAYVALAAIAGSFVLSAVGFAQFTRDQGRYEEVIRERETAVQKLKDDRAEAKKAGDKEKVKELEEQIEQAEAGVATAEKKWENRRAYAWKGHWDWLRVSPPGIADPDRGTTLQVGFATDSLSGLMFVMVTFIATLIHLFSVGYMSEELRPEVEDHEVHTEHGHLVRRGRFGRFFMFLSLFCFSMLNLVLADNLFQVFVSWELVGVCSYLLVGFYYERQSASNAANKAFIVNRVGDAGFVIGLLILWTFVGTFNFEEIFQRVRSPLADAHGHALKLGGTIVQAEPQGEPGPDGTLTLKVGEDGRAGSRAVVFPARPLMDANQAGHFDGLEPGDQLKASASPAPTQYGAIPYWMLVAAGLGIFLGCVGKSAQFPLQVWLPDAMEGPTPVSALIHAATMVAAGVYLVGRVYPLFAPEALLVIAYTGGITLFVAATVAVVMTDIKKVLAYSTVSQLGYMMLALGVGGWVAGQFHLLTHAFFKALLFLCSGAVIYGCHHQQDMLKMGGLFKKMPITAVTMLFGVLAIAGIPLFTGWYSKDSILAQAFGFSYVHREHLLLFLLPLVTAGITAFYMARMWFMTFMGPPRDHHVHDHAVEPPWPMTVPLVLLAVCSLAVAWGWPIYDAKESWLEHNVHHAQPRAVLADFGHVIQQQETWDYAKRIDLNERHWGDYFHHTAGNLALGLVAIGIVFAALLYLYRVLDPAEAKEQFPGLAGFLTHKWYFDELYSAILVRPALVVAHAFRWFDLHVIDGVLHGVAYTTLAVKRWNGWFDFHIIDGLANLIGNTIYGVGAGLRNVQTGYLRSYVLFLVLAAVGIFVVLSYFVAMAAAG
jgi:NADH-quinone oxidoreductase subunit L